MLSLRRFVFLLIGSFLLACCELLAQVKPAPNVGFITIDTLRADHLGCYGTKQIPLPNIYALASHAVLFHPPFHPVPLTLPARTSLSVAAGFNLHRTIKMSSLITQY